MLLSSVSELLIVIWSFVGLVWTSDPLSPALIRPEAKECTPLCHFGQGLLPAGLFAVEILSSGAVVGENAALKSFSKERVRLESSPWKCLA